MTILQSWSQGVEVWGREGMRKLWSAANIKVYGGGVSEVEFLQELSSLVGDFELQTASTTHSPGRGGGRSTSFSSRRERILDVSDLGSLPKGRLVVFASGVPPILARSVPWMDGPHAAAVKASIEASTRAHTGAPAPGRGRLHRRRPRPRRRRPTPGCARERARRVGRAAAPAGSDEPTESRPGGPAARAVLRAPGGLRRRLPRPGLPPQPQRPQHRLVPGMVAPPRGRDPAGGAVARLGAPASRSRHRHVGVAQRPRRPPHGRAAVLRRPVQGLRRRRSRRPPARAAAGGHAARGPARPWPPPATARRSER